MEIDFEGVEGLTDDQKAALSEKVLAAHNADIAGLKSKNSELIEKMKSGSEVAAQLEKEKSLAAEKLAEAQGNFEEAQRLANERMDNERKESQTKLDGYKGQLSDLYVTQARTSLAKELANTPEDIEVLEMFLQKHITMKDVEGKMETDFGEAGSRDALIENLKKTPSMARFISGTKAVGVGAKGAGGSGQAGSGKMTLTEKAKLANSDPHFAAQLNKG